uniref:Putative secreted protein n=1 Tax=Amblyomma parvum TaxID=251391 RepID=A0A023FZ30_AMBPA
MPSTASMFVLLRLLFQCIEVQGTPSEFETDARKVLFPPSSYWLYRRSTNVVDTSFTSNKHCVEIEYVQYNDTSDIAALDARNDRRHEHWEARMYTVSVKQSEGNVLQYTPYENLADTGMATVEYEVLHVHQNACYIVERTSRKGAVAARSATGTHKCELWLKKEEEVGHQRPTYTPESQEACKQALDVLCAPLELVYYQRLCNPILP